MTSRAFPSLKFIPLAVLTLLGGVSATAFATPVVFGNITLDATYSLGGGPTVNGTTASNPGGSANGADFYLSDGSGANSVFFHTYGFSGPSSYFGARASGDGIFTANTRTSFSSLFTNTSTSAQNFVFSFHVLNGEVGLQGTGTGAADLNLRIAKNGTDLARSHTTISKTTSTGPATCVEDDLGVLSSYVSCGSSSASSASAFDDVFQVNFGVVGAGESFTLDYDIIATISGVADASADCGGGYGGYGGYGGGLCHFAAIARSGDPFSGPAPNGTPDGSNGMALSYTQNAVDLPEPSALALTGLALAGLAATRRKKPQSRT